MFSFKEHMALKPPAALPATTDFPGTTPLYDSLAHGNKTMEPHYNGIIPVEVTEKPQHLRSSSKAPQYIAQAQNDTQTRPPLARVTSDGIPQRKGSITGTRREEIEQTKDKELERLNDELKQTKIKLHNAVGQLVLLHSTDPFREGDDQIARRMDQLRHDIRQWSQKFSQASKKSALERLWVFLSDTHKDESPLRELTAEYATYLKHGSCADLLVQGFIWRILVTAVFGCYQWLGGPCVVIARQKDQPQLFCPILESFQLLVESSKDLTENDQAVGRTYHHWRAHSARLFTSSRNFHQVCIQNNTTRMTKHLASMLKDHMRKKDGATEHLASIINSAISFDHLLWQQKAKFRFSGELPTPGKEETRIPFDPQWMTAGLSDSNDAALAAEGKSTVKFFTVPALRKQGTSEGENYSDEVVLCKAHVYC